MNVNNINREWAGKILHLIAMDPIKFYSAFFPKVEISPVGNNLRLNPCPKCGHYDCCTITPGEIVVNCFSPQCISGTHLSFTLEVLGYKDEILEEIGNFYNISYEKNTYDEKELRLYEIRDVASKYYHKKLLEDTNALTYQTQIRQHSLDILKIFQIGFSKEFDVLNEALISLGYTPDEIRESKVWVPEGLFIYPYFDAFSRKICRFNTKNPFNATYKGEVIKGFSVGSKTMMTTPKLNFDLVILVEGENDLMTVFAHGGESVIAVGGKVSKTQLETLGQVLPRFKNIYCMFDNDEPGREYETLINETFPHLNIYHVDYGNYKDPDDAFKNNKTLDISHLISNAVLLETKGYNISHHFNVWTIENRKQKLEFEILDKNRNGSLIGTVKYFEDQELKDMQYDISLAKCKFKPLSFYLISAIEEYFNNNLEDKSLEDLVNIYYYTKWKTEVIRLLGLMVFRTEDSDKEQIVTFLKRTLGDEITDIVLKEVNELQNEEIVDFSSIPKMKIGQFFSVRHKEAFMYFTYVKKDGDTIRKLPYLLVNDKKLIRLDLYKRKDEQCLLLIRNKYELPIEVPQAIMDLQRISLTQSAVEDYVSGKIESRDLSIKLLIRRIEAFLRKYFYNSDENIYKVLALWIYGTYCYELFGQYPYIFLNGPKGSGKTVIDVCIDLLAFNPKMTISITNAALFRSVSIEGGTLILDEMENLTNRKQAAESDLAAILKGGYMRAGSAMRCDKENGFLPQMFDVFGPKVVSNIAGLEDIISDRCIQINTVSVNNNTIKKLEDPKQLYIDGLSSVKELTSKCALSVLENFIEIYQVYREKVFNTDNARLAQILRPIQALAYLAGPDYERALLEYYSHSLKVVKEEVEYETPEGALKDILYDICQEIMGVKEPNYISSNIHKYKNSIKISLEEGWFEIDVVHIKTFMEEVTSRKVDSRQINTWVRRVSPVNMYTRKRRTTIPLEDPALIEEYNGNTRLKVHVYKFYLTDFFPEDEVAKAITAQLGNNKAPSFNDL